MLLSADQGERKHPMRGYDDTYVDIVDFIIRVTHRIWEEKDIGHIYDTYRHNCRVTDDYGLQYGRDKIVADTVHTINAFPDVRLYADEVIWAGDEDRGFETSHRTVIVGHNTGYSKYGPPTGRKVVVWAIANCSSRENEFYEEWVLYNNSSLLASSGSTCGGSRVTSGNATHLDPLGDQRFGEAERLAGQGKPARPAVRRRLRPGGLRARDVARDLELAQPVDDRSRLRAERPLAGPDRPAPAGPRRPQVLRALDARDLPRSGDLGRRRLLDGQRGRRLPRLGPLVRARHASRARRLRRRRPAAGWRIWGISQHRIEQGRITQEWTLFNEFEVLQQILRDEPVAGAA